MSTDNLYNVYAEHDFGRSHRAIAQGDPKDIEAYYTDGHQGYGLILVPVSITTIPEGYADRKEALLARRDVLEAELRDLKAKIDGKESPEGCDATGAGPRSEDSN